MLAVVVHQVAFSTGRSAGNDFLAALLGRLDVGIAICFVLSGFLMYQPFAMYQAPGAVGPSVVRFWQRRAIRIVPALWLTVAVTFALTERSESVADWLRHVALIQAVDFRYINVYLSHLWSISVLVGFCILVPVVGTIAATGARDATSAERRHLAVVGLLFCVAVAFNILQRSWDLGRPAQQWLPAYLDWFAFGMFLAVIASARPDVAPLRWMRRTVSGWAAAPGSCWSVAALLWLLSATQLGTPRNVAAPSFWQWTTEHVLYGLAAFFTVLPVALGNPDRRRVLGSRPAQLLGVTAYGTFLWHLPVMVALQQSFDFRPFGGHFPALVSTTVVGAVACGCLSWFLLERPMLRYGSEPWRGSPATNVIATATTHNV